jgi:hypothetical protein
VEVKTKDNEREVGGHRDVYPLGLYASCYKFVELIHIAF